ncbi:MAG TPA: type III pantothenate kinase [Gammaproteobacteria bacterium]
MLLLLDVGNSRIKWAVHQDGKLGQTGAFSHKGKGLRGLASDAWNDIQKPDRVIVSNVIGRNFSGEFDEFVNTLWGVQAEYVKSSGTAFGVSNAYPEPGRLGADRWTALIAARHQFNGDVCIIDCGTALTIDLLAANGQHLGGLIIPGLSMMRAMLMERTAGINMDQATSPGNPLAVLPSDTHEAVYAGTLYASIAVIDRVVADVSPVLGAGITRVITGGDAEFLSRLLKGKYHYEPDLVLKGLAIISGPEG